MGAEVVGGGAAPRVVNRLKGIERKKESTHQTRDGGGRQGPHLHEQDFGRTIRGAGRWGSPGLQEALVQV